jgi:hypothetical protein
MKFQTSPNSLLVGLTPIVVILAASFLFVGCGKKPATPPPAKTVQTLPTPGSQKNAASSPASTSSGKADAGNVAPNLVEMSDALNMWVATHSHMPTNFAEFADDPNLSIQIPPPPPGKKYAIDGRRRVILVNR